MNPALAPYIEEGLSKVIYTDDWSSALWNQEANSALRLILPGEKMAFSHAFSADDIARNMPDKDHFLLHQIAIGAFEKYAQNRNGDAFSRADLKECHPTFVTHGCYYREHRNRCPETQGIGIIKASAYNDEMDRVELLIWGHTKKAEDVLHRLQTGKDVAGSMSCKLKHDVCSCCFNKSANLKQYCEHLRKHMNKYLPEFRKYAFAHNPKPRFFDYSDVERPADRTAFFLDYWTNRMGGDADGMLKAASNGDLVIPGAMWAEYEGVNLPIINDGPQGSPWSIRELAMLRKLAQAEEILAHTDHPLHKLASTYASLGIFNQELSQAEVDTLRDAFLERTWSAFTKRASIIPFLSFLALTTGKSFNQLRNDPLTKEACAALPGVFGRVMDGQDTTENMYDPGCCSRTGDPIEQAFKRVDERFGVNPEPVRARVLHISLTTGSAPHVEKCASHSAAGNFLAQQYGQYVVKQLVAMDDHDLLVNPDETALMIASNNFAAHR